MKKNCCKYNAGFNNGYDEGHIEGYYRGFEMGAKDASTKACLQLIDIMKLLSNNKIEVTDEIQDAIHKLYYELADDSFREEIELYWDKVRESSNGK